jgi:hypothetical protein
VCDGGADIVGDFAIRNIDRDESPIVASRKSIEASAILPMEKNADRR